MYAHVTKDGSVLKMTNQAKQALDHTIENNENIKKQAKLQRIDKV